MVELLADKLLLGSDSWSHLFDDIRNCLGEVESAITKAGPFEPSMNDGLGQGIYELLDAMYEYWGD